MREGRANGGVGPEGAGADAAPVEAVRRQKQPQSNASSSGSAASSSSGGGEAEERGGKDRLGRRRSRRREDVVRAIRDRLPAAPSCWGNSVSVVQERRGRRERPSAGDAVEVEEGAGSGSGAGAAAALPAWCCICPEGDCRLEANPSANGKEDPGLRSLLELNDFYSDDCNPHATATTAGNANANANANAIAIEVVWKPKTGQIGRQEKEYEMTLKRTLQSICLLTVHPNTTTSVILQVMGDDGSI